MSEGLLASFEVDDIQLLMLDPDHEIRHLLSNNGIPVDAFPYVRFVDDLGVINQRFLRLKSPWLGPFLTPEYNNLFDQPRNLKSIAISATDLQWPTGRQYQSGQPGRKPVYPTACDRLSRPPGHYLWCLPGKRHQPGTSSDQRPHRPAH